MTATDLGSAGGIALCGLYGVTLAVAAFGLLIPKRGGVVGTLCFAGVMASLAIIGVLLDAHFIAITQLLCYSAAAMVLFLCGLMLLDRSGEDAVFVRPSGVRMLLGCVATGVTFGFLRVLTPVLYLPSPESSRVPDGYGGFHQFGALLFSDYSVIVAGVGVLLLATVVSAASFAGRRAE